MSGPDDIYDGTVAEVRAMTAPTPREVLADLLYRAVVQPELTWWDDLTPEMQNAWLRAADVALTRREPLDVERLADVLMRLPQFYDRNPEPPMSRNEADARIETLQTEAYVAARYIVAHAAEYARLEAAK